MNMGRLAEQLGDPLLYVYATGTVSAHFRPQKLCLAVHTQSLCAAAPPDSMNMGSLVEQLGDPSLHVYARGTDDFEEEDMLFGSTPQVLFGTAVPRSVRPQVLDAAEMHKAACKARSTPLRVPLGCAPQAAALRPVTGGAFCASKPDPTCVCCSWTACAAGTQHFTSVRSASSLPQAPQQQVQQLTRTTSLWECHPKPGELPARL